MNDLIINDSDIQCIEGRIENILDGKELWGMSEEEIKEELERAKGYDYYDYYNRKYGKGVLPW